MEMRRDIDRSDPSIDSGAHTVACVRAVGSKASARLLLTEKQVSSSQGSVPTSSAMPTHSTPVAPTGCLTRPSTYLLDLYSKKVTRSRYAFHDIQIPFVVAC